MDGCRELRTSSLTRKAPTGRGPAQSRQKKGIWERKHSSQRLRIGDEEGGQECPPSYERNRRSLQMDGGEGRMRLKDKVALVTGSSGGLGTGICRAFAAEGADCVVNYHSDRAGGQETADLVERLGRRSLLVQADISREDQVQAMVDAALERFGRLDVVVANAGYGLAKPLLETRVEEFEKLVRTNLIGTYLTVRIGAQAMKTQGSGKIITMSSVHGLGGTHYCSLYEATKAGILNFTRGAAFDLGDYNIQVNCIAPGAVPVPKDPPPDKDGPLYAAWMQYTPLSRFGTPADVAAAAVFLACSDSDWITGQVIVVDGGITAGHLIPSFKYYGAKPRMD